MLVKFTNRTCEKYSMAPQAYKVVNTHANETSVWISLSNLIHTLPPNLGGTNDGFQSNLATPEVNNGEQPEYFHIRIFRLHQEIILYGETVSPTRLVFHYTNKFSMINKLKALIALNIIDLTTFLDNNGELSLYTGGNIHGIYSYLVMIDTQLP